MSLALMDQFISDVSSGKLPSGELVKLAVKRHLKDLKQGHKRGLFFSDEAATHAIDFISLLKHTKGDYAGKPFNVQPFQAFIIGSLFGWQRKTTINGEEKIIRRFKLAYNEVSRKNGKTELAGGIGNYMLIADGEYASEVYTAATKKPQAAICLRAAKTMVNFLRKDSKKIRDMVSVGAQNIFVLNTESKMEALAADSDKEDGLSPHCGIIDEYHAHPTSELMEVIKTGMGGRLSPLLFIITTAGFNKLSPCFRLRKTIIDILRGHKDDDSTFGIIFTLDDPEDWNNEKEWIKANPNIGNSPYWHYMRDQYVNAVNMGGEALVQFRTKNLNLWENTGATWIPETKWNACQSKMNHLAMIAKLEGCSVWMGLDMAAIHDVTALRLLIEDADGKLFRTGFFYLPEAVIEARTKEGTNYREWVKQGHLLATPGNTTSSAVIEEKIMELSEIFSIQSVQYDSWNARDLAVNLYNRGINMVEHSMTIKPMAFPTKQYEKMIHDRTFEHDGNPVQKWMLSNVELYRDINGNYKPDKKRSTEKIDGVIADIMATSGWLQDNYQENLEGDLVISFV